MLEGEEQEVVSQESSAPEADGNVQSPSPVMDLDTVEKFKFNGREWTPKDFQGAYMMQSDYTRKTQALAEERRYYDNLDIDLAKVKSNPTLAEQFKSVYPEKFHKFLGYVASTQPANKEQSAGIDPDFKARFERLEQTLHEKEVSAAEAELDSTFKEMTGKYPYADEEAVLARAQSLLDRNESLNKKVWDNLFKSSNEKNSKLADRIYSEKVNKQKTANSKGRDIAAGGGTPGQAPKLPRNIKEASNALLESGEL